MKKWLQNIRKDIDDIDLNILELLEKRFEIIRKVGHYKKDNDIPMMQSKRVEAVLNRCSKLAGEKNLNQDFVVNFYRSIIEEACRVEDEIILKK